METSWRPDVGRVLASHGFSGASWSQLAKFGGVFWEWLVDARGPREKLLGTNSGPLQGQLGFTGGLLGSVAIACELASGSLWSIMVALGTLVGHPKRALTEYPGPPWWPQSGKQTKRNPPYRKPIYELCEAL